MAKKKSVVSKKSGTPKKQVWYAGTPMDPEDILADPVLFKKIKAEKDKRLRETQEILREVMAADGKDVEKYNAWLRSRPYGHDGRWQTKEESIKQWEWKINDIMTSDLGKLVYSKAPPVVPASKTARTKRSAPKNPVAKKKISKVKKPAGKRPVIKKKRVRKPFINRAKYIKGVVDQTWEEIDPNELKNQGTLFRVGRRGINAAGRKTKAALKAVHTYMKVVAEAFATYLRDKLNVPVQVSKQSTTGIVRRVLKNGKSISYNRTTTKSIIIRSRPGEFPRRETGSLRASLFVKLRTQSVYAGKPINMVYATIGFHRNQLFPYPVWHPGYGKWRKTRPPSYYSMILEFRMQRKLIIKGWRDANSSGYIRSKVQAAGLPYFKDTERVIRFPSFNDAYAEITALPSMKKWMEVDFQAIQNRFGAADEEEE